MNSNIKDYTHRAKRKNKTDIVFSVSAYISAAVLYFSSIWIPGIKYVPVLQFLALIMLVVGIFINQRYTWTSFVYGVIPEENKNSGEVTGSFFVVYRLSGKRRTCLAKINMADCLKIIRCTHRDPHKNEISHYGSPTEYNFCATMCPAEYYRAVFSADGGIAVIGFEPDSTLIEIIKDNLTNEGEKT